MTEEPAAPASCHAFIRISYSCDGKRINTSFAVPNAKACHIAEGLREEGYKEG
jgi:hypothetical protein